MAIDTPARLAILGAGPIGLEAALYARFLGYEVVVYERGEVAENVGQQGDTLLTTPFEHHRTTLGLAALQAQDESYQAPADDAVVSCRVWRERYLLPLAASDLLSDHLRLNTTVVALDFVVSDDGDDGQTGQFRVQARGPGGESSVETFDGVLDCTGRAENPDWSPGETGAEFFYVLGSRTAGDADFLLTTGYEQIRAAFAAIGDRQSLDLYASFARLLR